MTEDAPLDVAALDPVADGAAEDENLSLDLETPATGRYLVVWLTSLPADGGGFRGRVAEVEVQAVDDGG